MKRRRLNVFSLSFLDIITCGLGAVILLFVLINAKSDSPAKAHKDTSHSSWVSEYSSAASIYGFTLSQTR
jgi:hypothetical protein